MTMINKSHDLPANMGVFTFKYRNTHPEKNDEEGE